MAFDRATIRRDIFRNVYTFMNNLTITGGYKVYSSFPERDTVYPLMIIDPAKISYTLNGLDISNMDAMASVVLTFYDVVESGKASVDNAMDSVINSVMLGDATWLSNKLHILDYTDLSSESIEIKGRKVNMGVVELKMRVM